MTIRNDFVSNSSSSSFIIISSSGKDRTDDIRKKHGIDYYQYLFPHNDAKHEFGWEFENTADFDGKMNFIGIQLLELLCMHLNNPSDTLQYDFDKCYQMLKKVCFEKFGIKCVNLDENMIRVYLIERDNDKYHPVFTLKDGYYIDHQSCVTESRCMDMFESETALYDFLRFDESFIQGGNDNVE